MDLIQPIQCILQKSKNKIHGMTSTEMEFTIELILQKQSNDIKAKAVFMSNLSCNACVYPFKGAMLQHGLPATPCCRFHDRFLDDSDKESINTFDVTFADIRETMMRNEWHPGCYKCKADEESKGSSMRTEADNLKYLITILN